MPSERSGVKRERARRDAPIWPGWPGWPIWPVWLYQEMHQSPSDSTITMK